MTSIKMPKFSELPEYETTVSQEDEYAKQKNLIISCYPKFSEVVNKVIDDALTAGLQLQPGINDYYIELEDPNMIGIYYNVNVYSEADAEQLANKLTSELKNNFNNDPITVDCFDIVEFGVFETNDNYYNVVVAITPQDREINEFDLDFAEPSK